MKFFKHLYLLYLSLIPTLALGAIGLRNDNTYHPAWWFFIFLGVIIYLDIVVEISPIPSKKSHLIALASIPLQLGIAFYNSATIWNIFAYNFIVQTIAMLSVLVYISATRLTQEKSDLIKKSVTIVLLLLLPTYAIFKIFIPIITQVSLSFNTLFLATALYTNIATLYAASKQKNRGDLYFGYIIIGIFSFIILGPALLHYTQNNLSY